MTCRVTWREQGSRAPLWLEGKGSSGQVHVLLGPLQKPVNPGLGSFDGSAYRTLLDQLLRVWRRAKGKACKTQSLLSESAHLNEHFGSSVPPLVPAAVYVAFLRYFQGTWYRVLGCSLPIKFCCATWYLLSTAEGIQAIHSLSILKFSFGLIQNTGVLR